MILDMETRALLFSTGSYQRDELARMSDGELYELASAASTVGYDEASILTLDELSCKVNDDAISLDAVWIFFVNV